MGLLEGREGVKRRGEVVVEGLSRGLRWKWWMRKGKWVGRVIGIGGVLVKRKEVRRMGVNGRCSVGSLGP